MDELSNILNNISIDAGVFFAGNLCGSQTIGGESGGNLHLLKSGRLTLITNEGHKLVINKPSVIYIPGSIEHRISAAESDNVRMVCATVGMDSSQHNQLVSALPQLIHLQINENDPISRAAEWLFQEAFEDHKGRRLMLDKLSDIFLLQVLRHIMSEGLLRFGILAGLSHPQLALVIQAINDEPEKQWTLEILADMAAMSRSKFATFFRETVGQTPNSYITDIRIAVAQGLLKRDKPVSLVANQVGYEHGSALARVFRKKLGMTPKEWLKKIKGR